MPALECKVGFDVVVEAAASPSRFRVATLALFAVAAMVPVIIFMAGNAILVGECLLHRFRMARLAVDVFVQAL